MPRSQSHRQGLAQETEGNRLELQIDNPFLDCSLAWLEMSQGGVGETRRVSLPTWVRSGEKRPKRVGLEHVAQSQELMSDNLLSSRLEATGEGG